MVEAYLKTKDQIIIPIGSTEQHGPTGLIGTDFVTAQKISQAAGQQQTILVAPPICYGMAMHHMAFPGSATLTPLTFITMLSEIIQAFAQHGFRRFLFINGHGGNIAPTTTAFSQALGQDQDLVLKLFNWWQNQDVVAYEQEHFGESNGQHATCGEVSLTQHLRPQAFEKIPVQKLWSLLAQARLAIKP